jgi:hypothetical protein
MQLEKVGEIMVLVVPLEVYKRKKNRTNDRGE